jgi:hypothetical protein
MDRMDRMDDMDGAAKEARPRARPGSAGILPAVFAGILPAVFADSYSRAGPWAL